MIVVDDGSSDDTARVAEDAGATLIRHERNQGKAQAINTGLQRAREIGAQIVVLLDGDGQHNPEQIPTLVAPIQAGEADVVVGSRFLGIQSEIPRWRIFGQQALTLATNVASGVSVSDSQSGFRALSEKALHALIFRPNGGFSIESEMQFLILQHQLVVTEIPVEMIGYEEGPKRNPFGHGMQVINGIMTLVGQHRPLFFFGTAGIIILTMGLALGLYVVDQYNTYQELAVGTALISLFQKIRPY